MTSLHSAPVLRNREPEAQLTQFVTGNGNRVLLGCYAASIGN